MAHIVVLGAGLGGVPAAYELKQALGKAHRITVVSDRPYFQFTPSNPWVGVGWRKREDITVELEPIMKRRGIAFIASGALGNLVDRVQHVYVVDFIRFHIHDVFEWPTFNVADSTITVGVILLLIDGFFSEPGRKEDAGSGQGKASGQDTASGQG